MQSRFVLCAYLIFSILSQPCYGAAANEAQQNMTLFQALSCAIVNRKRTHAEKISEFPQRAEDLMCEYAESKRVVAAHTVRFRVPGASGRSVVYAHPIYIPKLLQEFNIARNDIAAFMGCDEGRRPSCIADDTCGQETTPDMSLDLALNEHHPAVWEVPGDIAHFLRTLCRNFNVKHAARAGIVAYNQ